MTAPFARIALDPTLVEQFITLAEAATSMELAMGRIIDEAILEAPDVYHETIYALFADEYYKATGRKRSPRTLRYWRTAAITFSRHDIERFEVLPVSIRLESVRLADTLASLDKPPSPQDICQQAMDNQIKTVPALRHLVLGEPKDETPVPGWVYTVNRRTVGWSPGDKRWPRFRRWLAIGKKLFE